MSLEKVIVVGAGLGGLLASYVLLKRSFKVELLEEHDSIGLPRHCSGLVSDYVVGFLGGLVREHIMNKFTEYSVKIIEGNEFHEALTLSFRKPVYLVDRVGFEKDLYEILTSLGGKVSTKTVVTNVSISENSLTTSRGSRYYDLVVISEGANRRLVRSLNLCGVGKYLIGPQALLSVSEGPETVEVVVSPLLDSEGFGWVIPVDKKHVIIGLTTTSKKAGLLLKYFAKKVLSPLSSYKIKEFFGGLIPIDRPCEKITGKNYLIVGDAASTTKPVSRGGIYSIIEEVAALRDSLNSDSLNQDLIKSKYKKLLDFLRIQHRIYEAILSVGGYYKLVRSATKSGLKEIKILDYDKLIPDPETSALLATSVIGINR
ncbi:MAG: NAD(P)/FAD-dependent oxidoreductase [Desulfurococcaceae archaeon TW002]